MGARKSRGAHTPGPWISRRGKGCEAEVVVTTRQRDKCGQTFAVIASMDVDFVGPFGAEQRANRRLITASPSMLLALELIVSAISPDSREYGIAWAAIDQARGKARSKTKEAR